MKSGASGLLGFLAGVAVTALVTSLLNERGAEPSGAEPRATDAAAEREVLPVAHDDGPARAARPIEVAAEAAATRPLASASHADDALGLLVYGIVTDPSGVPVNTQPWMGMSFVPEAGAGIWTQIDDTGAYSRPGLRPGRWKIVTDLVGFLPLSDTIELSADVPALRHDLVLTACPMLAVKAFTSDGRPLLDALVADVGQGKTWNVGARVDALASLEALRGPPRYDPSGRSRFGVGSYLSKWELIGQDKDRYPEIPDDAMGLLELDVPPPVWVSLANGNTILASQRVEAGQTEVVFRLDPADVMAALATLDLRFVDSETRAPIPKPFVSLVTQVGGGTRFVGEDGRLHVDKIAPGTLRVDVQTEGWEKVDLKLSFAAGQHLDLGDVALNKARTLRGQALDADGKPIRTMIAVRELDRDPLRPWLIGGGTWRTEDDGRFDFNIMGRHRYAVSIADRERISETVVVDLHVGDVEGLVLRVAASTPVNLHFDWPAGEPHGVRVSDARGVVLSDWDEWGGQYVWTKRLLPGAYSVEVYDGSSVLLARPFEVAASALDLTLKP